MKETAMKHRIRYAWMCAVFLTEALFLGGCRKLVLEDRTDCPAFLFFDIENADRFDQADYVHVAAYRYPDGTFLSADTTSVMHTQDRTFCLEIKKSETVSGFGVLGFAGLRQDGTAWVADYGKQYAPLWRFSYRSEGLTESYLIPVEAVKDYSAVTVRFNDADAFPGTYGAFPYRIVVKSNTIGIQALDGSPVKGVFCYEPPEKGVGEYTFFVPRQFDRGLHIEVWNKEGIAGKSSSLAADFLLWTILKIRKDFSWSAKNLPDLLVEIDMTEASFKLHVVDWNGTTVSEYAY